MSTRISLKSYIRYLNRYTVHNYIAPQMKDPQEEDHLSTSLIRVLSRKFILGGEIGSVFFFLGGGEARKITGH